MGGCRAAIADFRRSFSLYTSSFPRALYLPSFPRKRESTDQQRHPLSKPQSKALVAFSVGIAKEEGCGLNAAAKKLPFAENPATVERRIQRFIANDGIDHAESCRAMAWRVIGKLPEDKPVVVLVDETGS